MSREQSGGYQGICGGEKKGEMPVKDYKAVIMWGTQVQRDDYS